MFKDLRGKDKKQVDYQAANEVLGLTKKILEVLLILLIILISWVALRIISELKIKDTLLTILGILSPLFIGIMVAWLLNPFVKWLKKYKIKRLPGVIISYILLIGIIALFMGTLIPVLYEQIVDFVESLPSLFSQIEEWLNGAFARLENIENLDIATMKDNMVTSLEEFGGSLASSLPGYVLNFGKTLISGLSTFLVGLVIGFFLLLSFENIEETFIYLFPKKWRKDADSLFGEINTCLKNYVRGVALDALVIFIICGVVFSIIGLRAPLLFAVFCAITNVIPYVGPYIGAVPAVIVGFSISPTVGLLTTASIVVIQFFEGNFLQEYIMSKTTKLHPVTIIIGLLIFGHFWGIIGMAISAPVIGILKIVFNFFDRKWKLLDYVDDMEMEEKIEEVKE